MQTVYARLEFCLIFQKGKKTEGRKKYSMEFKRRKRPGLLCLVSPTQQGEGEKWAVRRILSVKDGSGCLFYFPHDLLSRGR